MAVNSVKYILFRFQLNFFVTGHSVTTDPPLLHYSAYTLKIRIWDKHTPKITYQESDRSYLSPNFLTA